MPARRSIIGMTFTRLFVFAEAPAHCSPSGYMFRRSWVRCTCGTEFTVANASLIRGATQSCGCLNRELTRARATIHGHSTRTVRTPTYNSWTHMISRCDNPNTTGYHNYGGRGITVCRGLRVFTNLLGLLGERPARLEIDRWPNNETGHYSCGRCDQCLMRGWPFNIRWATRAQNNRNHRRNKIYTVNGVTACHTDLAIHFGLVPATVTWRLSAGWPVELAFTTPRRRNQFG